MFDFNNQNQVNTPEEISILEAIYGNDLTWEYQSETNPYLYKISLVLKIKSTENILNDSEEFCLGNITFLIDYTNKISPDFLLELNHKSDFWNFYEISLDSLRVKTNKAIEDKINELEGQNIIFPSFQVALETIEDLVKLSEKRVNVGLVHEIKKEKNQIQDNNQVKQDLHFHLIFIDHMRDYKNYLKSLNLWVSQLNLNGNIMLKNTLNGEMIKGVYLILKGDFDGLSEFSKRLKTHNIDVDSKGKPCKEKMSKMLLNVKANDPELIEAKALDVLQYRNENDLKTLVQTLYDKEVEFLTEFSKMLI